MDIQTRGEIAPTARWHTPPLSTTSAIPVPFSVLALSRNGETHVIDKCGCPPHLAFVNWWELVNRAVDFFDIVFNDLMIPQGKGVFVWQVKQVAGGDPAAIVGLAKAARLTHVLIKVADGKFNFNITNGKDMVPGLVAALRSQGIQAWGWQYIYGGDPIGEAKKGIERVKQFALDGFVVNAEKEFKADGMDKVAKKYMEELRKGLPNHSIGLSTYRYPVVHYQFPFKTFLNYCHFSMPQVYWINSVNPGQQLRRSVSEFLALKPNQPIVPTGSAFTYATWSATSQQLIAFFDTARELKLPGANIWEMATAQDNDGSLWKTISDYKWDSSSPPPNKEDDVQLPIVTLAKPNLNIRSGPGTQNSIVGKLPYKSSVTIVNIVRENGDLWGKTELGWIALRYKGSALTDICK